MTASAEMGADGQWVHARPTRDFADRAVDVVVENDHEALLGGKALERGDQFVVEMKVVGQALGDQSMRIFRSVLQGARRQAKSRSPDPAAHVADGPAAANGLGEGLGGCIERKLRVVGVGVEGAPQPRTVLAIHRFHVSSCLGLPHNDCHYAYLGTN